jgi:serine/threonine-protein kinase HipA
MNEQVVKVNLFNENLGFLSLSQSQSEQQIVFKYDEEFIEKNIDSAPITMPISKASQLYNFADLSQDTFKGLPGLIADSIPDRFGRSLIKEYFTRLKLKNPTALDCLCHIGDKAIGALAFSPCTHKIKPQYGILDIENLVKNAKNVFNNEMAKVEDRFLYIGSFIGGARAKALVNFDIKNNKLSLSETQDYLIKIDGITAEDSLNPQGYGRIEYAYYLMAKDIGIEIMPSFLLEDKDNRAHFITKRFDIIEGEKQHIQTFGAMAHFDFHSPQVASYKDFFAIIIALNMPYKCRLEGFRRMLFNIIGKNYDDHVKNLSFMMDKKGQWTLTPAYDLVFAHNNHNPDAWTRSHNMTINAKGNDISYDDILIEAKILELNSNDSKDIFEKTLGIFSLWQDYAKEAGVNLQRQKFIAMQIHESIKLVVGK